MNGGAGSDNSEDVLAAVGNLQVKSVSRREGTPECQALFDIALGAQQAWTLTELNKVTRKLDTTKLKVQDWLMLR